MVLGICHLQRSRSLHQQVYHWYPFLINLSSFFVYCNMAYTLLFGIIYMFFLQIGSITLQHGQAVFSSRRSLSFGTVAHFVVI